MWFALVFSLSPAYAQAAEAPTWRYAGATGEAEYGLDAIVAAVLADPAGRHFVWQPGWPAWKRWDEVPEIKAAVERGRTAAAWSYSDGGPPLTLTAAEITARIAAAPGGRHLVWRPGMADWSSAADVPEFAPAVAAVPRPEPPPPAPPPEAGKPASAGPATPAVTGGGSHAAAPPAPDAHPAADPPTGELHLTLGGEIRTSFSMAEIGIPDEAPVPTFALNRLRPHLHADYAEHWSAAVSLEIEQLALEVEEGAREAPDSFAVLPHEAWIQAGFETGGWDHHFRAGAQESIFGARDYYENYDAYFLGGEGYEDIPRLSGNLAGSDVGVAWHTGLDERLGVDLQAARGEAAASPESDGAVDLLARVSSRPIPQLGIWASVMTGGRESAGEVTRLTLGHGALEGRLGPVRIFAEGMMGARRGEGVDDPLIAALAAGAVDLGRSGPTVDHVTVVGRYAIFDPIAGNDLPDSTYTAAAAANVYWNVGTTAVTVSGLQWQMHIPQQLELPITHDLTLNVAARF